jgi:hypothetical protein
MSEAKSYEKIRKYLPEQGDRIDRIENLMVMGMPDINGCIWGNEFWMELKSPVEPKRASSTMFASNHKLSIDQQNWFLRQRSASGQAYVIIHTDKRWYLIDGEHADIINKASVELLTALTLWNTATSIAKPYEWKQLRQIIVNKRK